MIYLFLLFFFYIILMGGEVVNLGMFMEGRFEPKIVVPHQ